MSSHPFNSSFTKQFRQQPAFYTGAEEKPWQNIRFSTYGMQEREIQALGQALTDRLNDSTIIQRILIKLTNTDAPVAERLSAYIHEVQNELQSYASAEPFTAQYYNMLTEVLTSFLDVLNDFQVNGRQVLSEKLTGYFTTEANAVADNDATYNEEIGNMYNLIQNYLYQIGEYFEYFHRLLQQESENNTHRNGVLVISQVAHFLDTLITSTEKLVITLEATLDMLCTWETSLLNREAQELFN
jgi:hypothetical protein